MVVSSITSAIVAIVGGSWIASSIFLKYFITILIAKNLYQDSLSKENLMEDIMENSEVVVSLLVVSGLLITASGLEPRPLLELFSELTALGYFTVLFWKY